MPKINFIEVDREKEKRLYRIFKELELNGESKIDNAMSSEWNGTLRKLGIRAKPLINKGYIEPIWKTSNKRNYESRLIRTAKNIEIIEKKGNKKSFFRFCKVLTGINNKK